MAFENERTAFENDLTPESAERRTSAADYLISARSLSQKIVDRGRRQAEELLRDASARAEETVSRAQAEAEEILAAARAEAEQIRAAAKRASAPVDPEHAVNCVESCIAEMRQQHLDAIEQLNARWQQFLCSLYDEGEPDSQPEVPSAAGEKCGPAPEPTVSLSKEKTIPVPEQAAPAPETEGEEPVPTDLSARISAIADVLGDIEGGLE